MNLPDIKIYKGILSTAGHLMCAVDCETSGLQPGYHEILQLAIQPLDNNFEPYPDVLPFYVDIKPEFPTRIEKKSLQVNGMTPHELMLFGVPQDKCQDMLVAWFNSLNLDSSRKLIPLAQNWPFDYSFLTHWLGTELFGEIFAPHYRDTMELALFISDLAAMSGATIPFKKFNLTSLCSTFGISYRPDTHDALQDALTTAKVYPKEIELLKRYF